MNIQKSLIGLAAFLLVLIPITTHAHLAAGEDKTIGTYLVDFGYDPEAPKVGESTVLAINLVDASTTRPVEFDTAWLRLSQGDRVVFSGTLAPTNLGNATLSYEFPTSGDYEAAVTFKHDAQELVSATFTVPVSATTNTPPVTWNPATFVTTIVDFLQKLISNLSAK